MEPALHKLDREAMLAEHVETTVRVHRELDDVIFATVEKRRAFDEWVACRLRSELEGEEERQRNWADRRLAYGYGPRRPQPSATATPSRPGDAELPEEPTVPTDSVPWAATA